MLGQCCYLLKMLTLCRAMSYADGLTEWPGHSPILALNQTGGDVRLIIIENRAVYLQPTYDPLFSATRNTSHSKQSENWGFPQTFAPDKEVGIIGCTEKYQICNPVATFNNASLLCSELAGILKMPGSELIHGVEVPRNGAEGLDLNQKQLTTLRRLTPQFEGDGVLFPPLNLGQESLNASTVLFSNMYLFSLGLPSNQWQYEVLYWHKISLATLQKAVLDWALGPSLSQFNRLVTPARGGSNGDHYGAMCDQQKSLSPSHTNFSALGIILVLALGSLVAILNFTVPRLIENKRITGSRGHRAQSSWHMDETLQLQALGYKIARLGTWHDITQKDDRNTEANAMHTRKKWCNLGLSSERYPRTKTAEKVPSLYRCLDNRCHCERRSTTSLTQGDVLEVKHERGSSNNPTVSLMNSYQTW
jgi:hypothetical protein